MASQPPAGLVYHLELKSFPHTSRAFNLDRETLDLKFVKPWVAGEMLDFGEQRWAPDKTRLKILAGPVIDLSEQGMGRGWGEATRRGRDVTDQVIAEIHRGASARPEVEALKDAIIETASEPLALGDVMALAAAGHPGWKASEQLSLAEQAVWEMLHRHQLELLSPAGVVAAEQWQEIVLSWAEWAGASVQPIHVKSL